ncbi:MAG: phosphoribosyltransferase family protein [Bacilli bacterium]
MERTVAKCLLEIQSVFYAFEKPIIGGTGTQLPIYCDNRLILSYPRVRKALTKWLVNHVKEIYPDVEMIIGTAPAGIAFASLLSEHLGLPMGYVLSKKKEHAFKNRVEGLLKEGLKVLVVDDVIFSGRTLIDVVQCLRSEKCHVLGAVSIVSYELPNTIKLLAEHDIKYSSLTTYDVVNFVAMQTGRITYQQFQKAAKFKENPDSSEWVDA